MSKKVLTADASQRIGAIHDLSRKVNKDVRDTHREILMQFIEHHVEEIRDLLEKQDEHVYIETGDLVVLCLELLIEGSQDVNETLEHCLARFEQKLKNLDQGEA